MDQRIVCIILILLTSHLPIMESASAQIAPAIDLECQSVHPSGNLELYVSNNSSGNVSDYAECTVSNPNLYQEKIRIIILSGPLNQEGPADFDIIVYEETNETEDIISVKSDDDQSLIYAGSGGAILLLLILFIFVKRRK